MNEEEPAVPTWPSARTPMATRRDTKSLEELQQGAHRASWHSLARQKSTLMLQASQEHHTYHPERHTNHMALRL